MIANVSDASPTITSSWPIGSSRRAVIGARLGHVQRGEQDRGEADRDVDEEHRPPAAGVDQRPADHGPERHAQPEHRAPQSDRHRPLAGVLERVADDRHRDRVEHRPAYRLHDTSRDQEPRASVPRPHSSDPSENTTSPTWKTRRRPIRSAVDPASMQQAREHQRVGVDRPLQPGERRVQVVMDRRQRDVDDRRVETDDQQAHAADARAPAGVLSGSDGSIEVLVG